MLMNSSSTGCSVASCACSPSVSFAVARGAVSLAYSICVADDCWALLVAQGQSDAAGRGVSGGSGVQVPYRGEFLLRPAARNEVSVLVEPLATASIKLNEWLGFYSEENLEALHPVFRKAVVQLRRRGCYVDLRRVFEHESLAFLTLTSAGLFFVFSHFLSHAMSVIAICVLQVGLLAYCIM